MQPTNPLQRPASWVIVEKSTGKSVLETFNPKIAEAINQTRYEAVPILAYLQSLNRKRRLITA